MQPDGHHWRPFLLSDIVETNRRWVPDRTALIFKDRTWTWAAFGQAVDALQRGLALQGVRRGTRVAVLDRNSDDCVLLHYALAGMGAVLAPINMWLRVSEIGYILGCCQPGFLLTSDEFRPLAEEATASMAEPPRLITRGAAQDGDLDFSLLMEAGRAASVAVSRPAGWEDPHLILHTSGTTGRPKGALISHRRSITDALSAIGAFGIRTGERFFCYMPLFHTGAWDYLKLYFMQFGSAVIVDRFEPKTAIEAIALHRCNGMFGVPVVLRQMVESPAWTGADLSSMRLIAYANYDPSSYILKVVDALRERGAKSIGIANAYGLSESGPYITILRPEDALERPRSIGTPVPGARVALLDEHMNEVAPGAIGEICVRTPAVMSGYLNRPEATEAAFAGGWLHTGDLGRVDDDGFLHLVDRQKDMIRTGGENVYAKEVENVLVEHPGVRECAVIGLPDDDYGERVVAVVVLQDEETGDGAELTAFVRSRIAGFKTPREIVFVSSLPKTPAGKIQKHVLRQQLAPKGA